MKNIMLDLETLGKGSNAAIAAIGAVEFDMETNKLGRKFYRVVDIESSVDAGGVIDASTVIWWMKQSETARIELTRPGEQIAAVLLMFSEWLNTTGVDIQERCVWGNGAAFDNVILRNQYERLKLDTPWEFFGDRCYRTLKSMRPEIKLTRSGTHHCAVDDAYDQAVHLLKLGYS